MIGRFIHNISSLLDREIDLAKVEARETVVETVRGAGTLIAGIVVLLLAMVALIVAGILTLALLMPGWLAGLIAFGVLAATGMILALVGKDELSEVRERPLNRTRESLQEDIRWARHQLVSSER